jgi:hypothetical protein
VLKDLAQLRDPAAKFDPRKRDDTNLLASIAGLGLLPATGVGSSFMLPQAQPPYFASQ